MDKIRALVVDDDGDWAIIWEDKLTNLGMEVEIAHNLTQARFIIRSNRQFEVAVLDKGDRGTQNELYGYHDGLVLAKEIRNQIPWCRILIATGEEFSRTVFDCGANAFAEKGYVADYLESILEYLGRGSLEVGEEKRSIVNLTEGNIWRRQIER